MLCIRVPSTDTDMNLKLGNFLADKIIIGISAYHSFWEAGPQFDTHVASHPFGHAVARSECKRGCLVGPWLEPNDLPKDPESGLYMA